MPIPDAAVLLLGETGTGKELVAHAIHEASAREEGAVCCCRLRRHDRKRCSKANSSATKGAFTGATHRKQGWSKRPAAARLFLDEIGELPLSLQVKPLRLLETGTYRRVGGLDWLPADFRLITATPPRSASDGAGRDFRRDLYFRINTFPIRTLALHERARHIPLLCRIPARRVDRKTNRRLSADAQQWLSRQRAFSGNIRELRT